MKWMALALTFLLLLAAPAARAAVTCTSITSGGFAANYVNNTTVGTQISFTVTCNRTSATEATGGLSYTVTADNGLQPTGQNNNARLVAGATTANLRYDFYVGSCAGAQWKGNTTISGTVNWPAGTTGNASDTRQFWACINTAQTAGANGTYTDTGTMTMSYNPGTGATTLTGSIPVSIFAPASCSISSGPGNFALSYTAFQPGALVNARSFTATCSAGMGYSLAISPSTGTLAGVNYSIDVTNTGAAGSVLTDNSGTGAAQTMFVRVTAPGGQPGTCTGASCTASTAHTLTITY